MLNIFIRHSQFSKLSLLQTGKVTVLRIAEKYLATKKSKYTRYKHKKREPVEKMDRLWERASRDDPSADQIQYRLMSYNILSQELLLDHLHLYLDHDPDSLRWEKRLICLQSEISSVSPDILCLQEMQYNHLKTLVQVIRGAGRKLEYLYKKKTGDRPDGCAIIYDKEKFKLLEERAIEYFTPGVPTLNRENIALLARFCPKDDKSKDFVVATTHLLYNPRREDVRMSQVKVLLSELDKFSSNNSEVRTPILLTGDFNFPPLSPAYNILVSPFVAEANESDEAGASGGDGGGGDGGGNEQLNQAEQHSETGENQAQAVSQPPPAQLPPLEMCPLNFGANAVSTYQYNWVLVDYILHSIERHPHKLKIWDVYKLPTAEELELVERIPHNYLGSDHYSLAIAFSVE